ncbi:hypothetical protein ACLOJK_021087 [Asimina triloba]
MDPRKMVLPNFGIFLDPPANGSVSERASRAARVLLAQPACRRQAGPNPPRGDVLSDVDTPKLDGWNGSAATQRKMRRTTPTITTRQTFSGRPAAPTQDGAEL